MTGQTPFAHAIPVAGQQTSVPADKLLHSANAGVIIDRIARIRNGQGSRARAAVRELTEYVNTTFIGHASAFVYEETFGARDLLHILVHLRSFGDYEPLLRSAGDGADFRGGVLGGQGRADLWNDMFAEGSVHDLVMQPHRWGMHGSLTDEMVRDPGVSPIAPDGGPVPRFDVTPAQAQTSLPAEQLLHTANSAIVIRRTADFDYQFRAEARVFARTIAETVNLNMAGLATVLFYEEDFGRMDRVHWYIHLKSLDVYYLLMGLDARVDPGAPRASYIQDWISPDKGGGSWEKMLIQGSVRDLALTPQC
jgi:hypothetical protein